MWVGFTALCGAIGPILGDASRFGFDMAFPAVFLVLLRGMWKSLHAARPGLVSLVTAALAYLFYPKVGMSLLERSQGLLLPINY